jgi:hypothetical protein
VSTIVPLSLGAVLLTAFAVAERCVPHPLLPLRMLVGRTRSGAHASVAVAGVAIFAVFLFLTYYLQQVRGDSPVATGLLFLPLLACFLVSGNLSSIVALPHLGPRGVIVAGMLLGGGGMAYLTRLTMTSSYARGVLPSLLVLGLGFGMIVAPAVNTATAGVARHDSGTASALVDTVQQVGGSIGIAALSTIAVVATASYRVAHQPGPLAQAAAATHGFTVAFAVTAALFGIGALQAAILLPSRQRH